MRECLPMKRIALLCALAAVALFAVLRPAAAPPSLVTQTQSLAQPYRRPHSPRLSGAVVYVAGAVARPGLYEVPEGARADVAVKAAGGFTAQADPASVNLAERVSDGEEIAVLAQGQSRVVRRSSSRSARRRKGRRHALLPAAAIDLNRADAAALSSLPGVGEILAARIVEYRRVNGPFASVDELADVAGMTQRRVDELAPYLRADPVQ